MAGRSSARASSGGQPAESEPFEVAGAPCGDDRAGDRLRVDADRGPGAVGPGAQLHRQVGQEDQLVGCPIGVAGHKLIQHAAVRLRHGGLQQRGRGDHQHPDRLAAADRV
jgi:hypothetical protein